MLLLIQVIDLPIGDLLIDGSLTDLSPDLARHARWVTSLLEEDPSIDKLFASHSLFCHTKQAPSARNIDEEEI